MKTYVLTLLSLIVFMSWASVMACNTGPVKTNFCISTRLNSSMIARGQIVNIEGYAITIRLYEVYRGKEERCIIKVFTGPDFDCTGLIIQTRNEYFGSAGQVVLFHAFPIQDLAQPHEETGQYRSPYVEFRGHGVQLRPMLQVGNKLEGNFSENESSIKVREIHEMLEKCEVRNLLNAPRILCADLNVYPNPSQDAFSIGQNIPGLIEVRLYDIRGRLLIVKKDYEKDQPVPIHHLSAGVYIIMAHTEGAIFEEKLLIIR